jgi:hypothetical protein
MTGEIVRCLCGATPIVEKKDGGVNGLFKYRCPNCREKELPWLGQWHHNSGALQEWNSIAPKKSYKRRTLEYNVHGVCVAEPNETVEWRDKKRYDHVTVKIYKDNGRFYYCYNYGYKNSGAGGGLGIGDSGFPTMELLKARVRKKLGDVKKIRKIVYKLFPENVQMELF